MENENFSIGDIVQSKAGRDSGGYYIIIRIDGIFAYICDGDLRKADKPKKKKLKHLKNTSVCSEYAASKLSQGLKVTNAELRRELEEFKDTL